MNFVVDTSKRSTQTTTARFFQENIPVVWYGTKQCFLEFWEHRELKTKEELRTIEKKICIVLQLDRGATCIINVSFSVRTFMAVRSGGLESFVCLASGVFVLASLQILKNSNEIISIELNLCLAQYKSDEYIKEYDILRSISRNKVPN